MALILPGPIRVAVGQDVRFLVTTSDTTLAAWVAATLTIRADPLWPRVGAAIITDIDGVDLQTWTSILTLTSTFAHVSATTYSFTATRAQTAAIPYGHRRCVLDVWRTDSGNTYPDVYPTWLDVVSPDYPVP